MSANETEKKQIEIKVIDVESAFYEDNDPGLRCDYIVKVSFNKKNFEIVYQPDEWPGGEGWQSGWRGGWEKYENKELDMLKREVAEIEGLEDVCEADTMIDDALAETIATFKAF